MQTALHTRSASRAGTSGMSLTELLVVLAIIGILVRISFPVFHRAKGRAQMTVCVSNLRQILQGIHMYASDYGGVPVHYAPGETEPEGCWQRKVYPYVTGKEVFVCPADPEDGWGTNSWCKWPCSYGYFYTGVFSEKGYREPSQRSVLLDDVVHLRLGQGSQLYGRYDGSVELAPRGRYRFVRVTFPDDSPGLLGELNAE